MSFIDPATSPAGRKARQRAIRNSILSNDDGDASDNRSITGVATATILAMSDNILSVYGRATDSQHTRGLAWYWNASTIANDLATVYNVTYEQACGVLAALSPSTDWDRNVALAHDMLNSGDCGHAYGDAIRKARLIRDGADPATVLGGRKVRSFYQAVYWAGETGHVVVDRHAHAVALGVSKPLGDWAAKALDAPARYQIVAAAYRHAARRAGIAPADMQAVTWVTFRETHSAFAAAFAAKVGEF